MHLAGSFNDWKLTAWPFQLLEDYVWEGRFKFDGVENGTFRISANEDGVIYWGAQHRATEAPQQGSVALKRLGTNIIASGVWSGTYRFRFYEEELRLEIEPTNEPEPAPVTHRSWTDARGASVEARITGADMEKVTLERVDGRVITIPLARLSAPDQEYVREWVRQNQR